MQVQVSQKTDSLCATRHWVSWRQQQRQQQQQQQRKQQQKQQRKQQQKQLQQCIYRSRKRQIPSVQQEFGSHNDSNKDKNKKTKNNDNSKRQIPSVQQEIGSHKRQVVQRYFKVFISFLHGSSYLANEKIISDQISNQSRYQIRSDMRSGAGSDLIWEWASAKYELWRRFLGDVSQLEPVQRAPMISLHLLPNCIG